MRIIHAIATNEQDSMGVAEAVRELVLAQSRLHDDVHLVVIGRASPRLAALVAQAGAHLHQGGFLDGVRLIRSLRREATIVHTHSTWTPATLLPLLLRGADRPTFVASPHGSLAEDALRYRSLKKRVAWSAMFRPAMKRHRLMLASSEKERGEIAARRLGRPIEVVPNPVSAPDPDAIAGAEKQPVIGYLGRLHAIKGVSELVEAWGAVAPEFPQWSLQLVGPAIDPAYLRKLTRLARGVPRVEILPPLYGRDRWRFLARCGVVAVPSRTENFCYVAAEAYLAGTPVVTTLGVPLPEIERMDMGWRGEGTAHGLAAMLRQALATDSARRNEMAETGKAFVEAAFNPSRIGAVSLAAYRATLS